MSRQRWELLIVVAAVLGAHGLAFFLVSVLPDAAILSLGIEGTRQEVLAAFQAQHQARSYGQVLLDLLRFDFGTTLDGIPVRQELAAALAASAPRLVLAAVLIFTSILCAALIPKGRLRYVERVAPFLAFLPPYVLPFIGLVALLTATFSIGIPAGEIASQLVAIVALGAAPAALMFTQARAVAQRTWMSDFARTLLAVGATPIYQRWRLVHNVLAEIAPSLEKVLTALVAVLLFVEPIFGMSGFGTTAVRAIKRSDIDLILAITFVMAVGVAVCRLTALLIRRHYGMAL